MTAAPLALACALLAGCALQRYEARPIDPAAVQRARLDARSDDATLRDALARAGVDVSAWPLPAWDLRALVALALQRHPDMGLARAELAAAEAARQAARARTNPGIELALEHHSVPGASDSPWSLGFALDALLVGSERSAAQLAQADALADAAVQQAAQAAWRVHARVRDAMRELQAADARARALEAEGALRAEETRLWQSRLALGAADARSLAAAREREADLAREVDAAHAAAARARQALAESLGLPLEALERLRLALPPAVDDDALPEAEALRREALLDRIDLRAQLARYAAADAALRTEVARQWPEITLKPGYAWDQGDNRWSLGLGFALPLFDRNAGPIARALAERDAEAAKVDALQARSIAELDAARLAARAARVQLDAARERLAAADGAAMRTARRVAAGDADREASLGARLALAHARRDLVEAEAAGSAARAALEDAVQRPLDARR